MTAEQGREHGIRTADGRVIVGPGWVCEADVMASMHGHAEDRPAAAHGALVAQDAAGEWVPVR